MAVLCISSHVPMKCVKHNGRHPWYNHEIVHLMRQVKRVRKRSYKDHSSASLLSSLKSILKAKMYEAKHFYHNVTLTTVLK